MQKIIAIGGGALGWGAAKTEVLSLSREIVRLSGKRRPRLLFLPTASLDDRAYIRTVESHFGRGLGCRVETLSLISQAPALSEIRRKILGADILYVGGGNTLRMISRWKKLGVDRVLREARRKGKVLCGPSAGAICWFRQGNSDSRKYRDPQAKLIKVAGLGFLDALACPHYDVEKDRKPELKAMMRHTPGVAIAMDNCAALEVVGDRCRAIASKPGAQVYRVFWSQGKYFQSPISKGKGWISLAKILAKG